MTNNSNNFFEEQRRFYDNQDSQNKRQSTNNSYYSSSTNGTYPKGENPQNDGANFKTSPSMESQAQTFKRLADYYNKNGEDKLIEDIFTTVKAQKANGTLSNEQLLKFAKSIYPMLNNSQREKIKELLPKLLQD